MNGAKRVNTVQRQEKWFEYSGFYCLRKMHIHWNFDGTSANCNYVVASIKTSQFFYTACQCNISF